MAMAEPPQSSVSGGAGQLVATHWSAVMREEIAKTVASPDEVEPELEHLFHVFRA
jgi:hypothetical protein